MKSRKLLHVCLFSAFIKNILTYGEFLRSASVVERVIPEDLIKFVNDDWERLEINEAGAIC